MIDLPYGLGAIPDEPDPRDYPLDALYAAEDIEPTEPDALPATYVVPGMPPVLNQHSTPMCVAFSTSALKGWQDRRDQERYFDFDEPKFFRQIGGTDSGAHVRDAMESLLAVGYPVASTGDPAHHKIAAYFVVPTDAAAIKAAILDLGPIVLSTPWYRSWFRPTGDGILPAPDVKVGGHAIVAYGWDNRGIRLRNSWGSGWGIGGDCWMPSVDLHNLNGAWKAADQRVHPIPWVRTVVITASPNLRLRRLPKANSPEIGALPHGHKQATRQLEKFGGRYTTASGKVRTDWLQVNHGGKTGWIARGYTRTV
jgi:hypothetical protein